MQVFLTLLEKIIPLYLIIALGYFLRRYNHINNKTIATLLIYVLVPVVVFDGAARANLELSTISLPFLFFILSCTICLSFYAISSFIWPGSEKNLIAYAAGTGNTGYFGLPVAIALFGEHTVPLMVMSMFGLLVYEASLGFFIMSRGNLSVKNSLMHVVKLPTIYAFALGLLVNLAHLKLGTNYNSLLINFRGAYSVLGMMLIGLGIGASKKLQFDIKFIAVTFFAKFAVWPLLILLIIFADKFFLHIYNLQIYEVMLLLSIVPLAANAVAFSTVLKLHPEKAALAVLLSTLFALFYIPLMIMLL